MGILKTNDAWTGPDKTKHVAYLAGGTLVAALLFGINWALVLGVAVAIGKEVVWDYHMERGTPSVQDLVASGVGVVAGALSYQVVQHLI